MRLQQEMGASEADLIAVRDRLIRMRGYCTKANPQPGCSPVAGVAKPMTAAVLATFKDLQFQLNRILAKRGKDTIAADGRIGGAVVHAMDEARAVARGGSFWLPFKTVDEIAFNAADIARVLKALANTIGAPTVVVETPAAPSVPRSDGGVTHPPDEIVRQSAASAFDFGGLSWKNPLVLAAIGVGALLLLRGRGRGRSRSRRSSRR